MCHIPAQKIFVYNKLNEFRHILNNDTKVLILQYIFTNDCYDESLTRELFVKYIEDVGSVALYINAHAFQFYMYHQPSLVRDYLERIEKDQNTHELLSQIYYYGLAVPNVHLECENKLEKILKLHDETVIATIIKTAFSSYSNSDYHEYAKCYIRRYTTENSEEVVRSYCTHCNNLSINDFDIFIEIFKEVNFIKYIEITNVLDYIKGVANKYPVECYNFIKEKILHLEKFNLAHSKIMEVIHIVYKRLNEEDDSDSLNEVMEMFENELYINSRIDMEL